MGGKGKEPKHRDQTKDVEVGEQARSRQPILWQLVEDQEDESGVTLAAVQVPRRRFVHNYGAS